MPQNPPPTSQLVLDQVTASTLAGDPGVLLLGASTYYVSPASGAWALVTATADTVTADAYAKMSGATANTDGSFTKGGASYWLTEERGVAKAVPK